MKLFKIQQFKNPYLQIAIYYLNNYFMTTT